MNQPPQVIPCYCYTVTYKEPHSVLAYVTPAEFEATAITNVSLSLSIFTVQENARSTQLCAGSKLFVAEARMARVCTSHGVNECTARDIYF
jgi:hypothetical protein